MNARDGRRVTADHYEAFIAGLCGMPPGPNRDQCVRQITRRLLMLYAEFSATPPAGLPEFAQRTGVTAGEELP